MTKQHLKIGNSIMIEPTNRCNLQCPLCSSRVMKRKRQDMPFGLFCEILNKLPAQISKIYLWNIGEPFVHPRIYKFIEYASENNFKVIVSTNVTLIKNRNIERLINSGLKELILCVDGTSSKVHENYRQGSDYQKILTIIKRIALAKKRAGVLEPKLAIQTLGLKGAFKSVEELLDLGRKLGIDSVKIKAVNLARFYHYKRKKELIDKYLHQDKRFSRFKGVSGGRFILKQKDDYCLFVRNNGTILSNGSVVVCCNDFNGDYVLGNIRDYSSYLKLVNANKSYTLRRKALSKKLDMCARCQMTENVSCEFPLQYE